MNCNIKGWTFIFCTRKIGNSEVKVKKGFDHCKIHVPGMSMWNCSQYFASLKKDQKILKNTCTYSCMKLEILSSFLKTDIKMI